MEGAKSRLFITEGHDRVDAHRAARGHVGGRNGHKEDESSHACESDGIVRPNPEQKTLEYARKSEGCGETNANAEEGQGYYLTQNHSHDRDSLGAESDADA